MGRRMMKEDVDKDSCFHIEKGEAVDIETVIRLRGWVEDEVRSKHGNFSDTSLITDYDPKREIFEFQIRFYR